MFRLKKSESHEYTEITISTSTYFKIALLVLATIVIVWGVRKVSHAILLILLSFFLALALNSPVNRISKLMPGKLKGNRFLATTISYLIVIILVGSFIAYVGPPIARQTGNFIKAAPNLISEFKNQNGEVGKFIRHHHLQKEVSTLSTQLSDRLHNVGGTALHTLDTIAKSVFSTLAILVLTFMMLSEGPKWVAVARDIIPDKHHRLSDKLARDMYKVIKGYVNGQVLLAFIAACLISPMLFIFHLSYPAALIVVIFICGLIPLVGHTLGAIIVTIAGLFHSTTAGIVILIYYLIYQQFENYVLQPKIQANSTNMSPLLVFGSLIVGLSFGGLVGGLLAIPVAGCLRIVVLEYLHSRHILGDSEFSKKTMPPKPTI